ncbi:MAG: hypothetical protein HND53_11155 [Proteobacteria bacterium]|nr:hypothetical protein [Pseudomonadota bacterium]NOG61051.1 hypothetical protein [Pseudomonadota bacterium]
MAKSDIDNVLDVHIQESQELLRELMVKLYKRNPRELQKSELHLIEEQLVRLFDLEHTWDFPELEGKYDIDLIRLTFNEEYNGDRVFAFVAGLMSMIMKSYNYQSEFYMFDTVDAQKLYNCARNIEIAVWKLSNNRDSNGEPFLYSNSLSDEEVTNLSYERLFGKLIATQDNITTIMAGKNNRTVKTVIQKMATAVFLPI